MAEIRLEIDKERDLTTVTVVGTLQPGQLAAVLGDYSKQAPTSRILIDSRQGSWVSIPTATYTRSIQSWIYESMSHAAGKTAIIFSDPADYGMGRLLENHLSMAGSAIELECFRDMSKAESWLFGSA